MARFLLIILGVGLVAPNPHPLYLYEGSICALGDGNSGVCRRVQSCPSADNQLHENTRYSSNSRSRNTMHTFPRCGFDGFAEIVCCPETDSVEPYNPDEDIKLTNWDQNDKKNNNKNNNNGTPNIVTKTGNLRKADRACEEYSNEVPSPLELYIIGGEDVRPGEFPHMAALGYERDDGIEFDCGGSLISADYVLTAAHCVVTLDGIKPTVARIGTISLSSTFDSSDTDYKIDDIVVHPAYRRSSKYNDLALLKLARPVIYTGDAHPACLYTSNDDPAGRIIVTGWGQTLLSDSNSRSKTLLKANLTVVSREECNPLYTETRDRKLPNGITQDQMCAVDRGGNMDSCGGDSGGPIQIPTNIDGMYKVIGVTSFGKNCGDAIPAIYVRISRYLDWIESQVWP